MTQCRSRLFLLLLSAGCLPACNLTVGSTGNGPRTHHNGSWSAACYRPQWGVMGLPHGTPYQWESAPPSLPFGTVQEEVLPTTERKTSEPREKRYLDTLQDVPGVQEQPETNDAIPEARREELPTPRRVDSNDLPPLRY